MFDIVIKNGTVVDGSGKDGYRAEIGIKDGKILKIGSELEESAEKVIDASGSVVCPGFIDVHSHSDYIMPFYAGVDSSIFQGITTSVVGNCGKSLAPIDDEQRGGMKAMFDMINPDETLAWKNFPAYLDEMSQRPTPMNTVYLLGMNNVVIKGKGYENRPITDGEFEKMEQIIRVAMDAGAVGMSTGLLYPPHSYMSQEEIVRLCKVLKPYEGMISSHIRCEADTVVESVQEFIDIVRLSGLRGQYSHAKVMGKEFWELSDTVIKLVEAANEEGLTIFFDSYPYVRSGDQIEGYLPPWLFEKGPDRVMEQIHDPEIRVKIKESILGGIEGWENSIGFNGFENVFIMSPHTDFWEKYKGKSIAEISNLTGIDDVWEIFFRILEEEGLGLQVTCKDQSEENVVKFLKHPLQMIGTDGVGGPVTSMELHPRYYGTYAKLFGKYVRDQEVLTLEEAVRKSTSFPANHFRIHNRGLLKSGYWADIVVFNPDTILEEVGFNSPNQFPVGFSQVIVNGEVVIDKSERTEKNPGRVLRYRP